MTSHTEHALEGLACAEDALFIRELHVAITDAIEATFARHDRRIADDGDLAVRATVIDLAAQLTILDDDGDEPTLDDACRWLRHAFENMRGKAAADTPTLQ